MKLYPDKMDFDFLEAANVVDEALAFVEKKCFDGEDALERLGWAAVVIARMAKAVYEEEVRAGKTPEKKFHNSYEKGLTKPKTWCIMKPSGGKHGACGFDSVDTEPGGQYHRSGSSNQKIGC